MTADAITASLRAARIVVMPEYPAAEFDPMSLNFVQDVWAAAVDALPDILKERVPIDGGAFRVQPRYIPGVFVCVEMSLWLAAYIMLAFAEAGAEEGAARKPGAFGRISYFVGGDPAHGHSINWFVDYDGNARFFEKQTGEEITLTHAEADSVFSNRLGT
jgi:hypothetical protein